MLSLFLLSLVQSVTEFLPVSSSGHLYLLNFFGISEQGIALDVLLHLGTLLAVLIYFSKDIWELILSLLPKKDKQLLLNLIIATIPVMVVGLFFFHLLSKVRSPVFVAINSIFWGIILWGVDKLSPREKTLKELNLKRAFIIGCAQILSLIPGTSRSGITITCARVLGINRIESARFSMLLSIPTISAAVVYVIYKGFQGEVQMPSWNMGMGAVFLTMFMGLLAITFLMRWVKKGSFGIFALYRILLGLFVLVYIIF